MRGNYQLVSEIPDAGGSISGQGGVGESREATGMLGMRRMLFMIYEC